MTIIYSKDTHVSYEKNRMYAAIITIVVALVTSSINCQVTGNTGVCGLVQKALLRGSATESRDVMVASRMMYRNTEYCWDFFNYSNAPGLAPPIDFGDIGGFKYIPGYCPGYCGTCNETAVRDKLGQLTNMTLPIDIDGHDLVQMALNEVMLRNVGHNIASSKKRDIEYGESFLTSSRCKLYSYKPTTEYDAPAGWGFDMCYNLVNEKSCWTTPDGTDLRDLYRLDLCHLASQLAFDYNHLCFKAYQLYICTVLSYQFNRGSTFVRNSAMVRASDNLDVTGVDVVGNICPDSICAQTDILTQCAGYSVPPYLKALASPETDFCADRSKSEVCPAGTVTALNADEDKAEKPTRMCYTPCNSGADCASFEECIVYTEDSFNGVLVDNSYDGSSSAPGDGTGDKDMDDGASLRPSFFV